MEKTSHGYISTVDPERETLGTQIIRAEESYDGCIQEVGDTMTELGRTICKGLEEAINNARSKGIRGRIYIHIVELPMPPGIQKPVVNLRFFTRASRPDAMWNSTLYYHDDDDAYPTLCWALPEIGHTDEMLRNPSRYTPEHLSWVQLMKKGLLF